MNGKQQTKHLLNLLHRSNLWSTASLADDDIRRNFKNSLPPPRSAVWRQQWAKPGTEKKEQLAKLWLAQVFAYGDTRYTHGAFANIVAAQWQDNMEMIKEMYPYWDDVFLDTLPKELAPKQLVSNWLRPTSDNGRWSLLHAAWFGPKTALLSSVAAMGVINSEELTGEYGQTWVTAGAYVCKKAASLPEAGEAHELAHLSHLFFQARLNINHCELANTYEAAWFDTGKWLNVVGDWEQNQSAFQQRYALLKAQPLAYRIALLYYIAGGTKLGANGEVRYSSEAYRWAYQGDALTSNTTIYDCAYIIVPEYSQQWRSAQDIGLTVTATIDSTRNITAAPSHEKLPEILFDF